jgi:ferrous iron transport protein B
MLLRAALVGNPNTGKTTLFNRLCGVRAKTANFPGTTTDARVGRTTVGDAVVEVLDLPGIYELALETTEAGIVRDVLAGRTAHAAPGAVVVIVDAANLSRNLVLVGEILAVAPRAVVCLNMADVAARRGLTIDVDGLASRLGVPVVPMVAPRGQGIEGLRQALAGLAGGQADGPAAGGPSRPDATSHAALVEWAARTAEAVVTGGAAHFAPRELTDRLDRLFTHPVLGLVTFFAVMGGLFWALFQLATVPMELIDTTFANLSLVAGIYLPDGPLRDLLTDGVIGGIAGTVVFLPQICLLFFLISLLEDTGYLARAAFVMDRFLHRFGLPGHSFVPLLTSHACALPGIMSTRLIPDRRDRLVTILVAPFMSCSARLPVFALLTTVLFVDQPALAAAAFAGSFVLGAGAAFLSAWLFSRTVLKGQARPMILELPAYQRPAFRNALMAARDQGLSFLQSAGTNIMAICIVMWWLSAYPRVAPPPEAADLRARAQAAAPADAGTLVAQAEAIEARAQQAGSLAGRIGRAIEPVFAPLGYDWQLTVGVLTSFLAREVFASTMAVLAGGADEAGVFAKIRAMTRADGTPVFSPATSASALVFFVLAMQCLPTLAVTRRETGRLRYAAIQLGYMSGVAYAAALVVYQGLRAMGVS